MGSRSLSELNWLPRMEGNKAPSCKWPTCQLKSATQVDVGASLPSAIATTVDCGEVAAGSQRTKDRRVDHVHVNAIVTAQA